ncbi:unnamed protein product [Auanema sp. JU1783]|nr:unnamed protein product [Auanema sp. JU1783]
MRLQKVLAFLLFFHVCDQVNSDPDYDDLLEEIRSQSLPDHVLNDDKVDINKKLALAVLTGRNCESNIWKCNSACKLEFPSNGTDFPRMCNAPNPGLKCFGIPINYSYVHEPFEVRFPSEYAILQSFPKCWKTLAPLICVRMFRPCAYHKFYHKTTEGKLETGTIEIWARVRRQNCLLAKKECYEIERAGFFPELLDCNDDTYGLLAKSSKNKTLSKKFFSDSCSVGKLPINSEFPGKCISPLVEKPYDLNQAVRPVIDSCFLPCRSKQIPDFYRDHQIFAQFFLSVFFFVLFSIIWAYLFFFSRIYIKSVVAYCFTQSLFSASIYFLIWSSTGISYFADAAECTGGVRRSNDLRAFDWCVWQSVFLHYSYLSSLLWLLAHYAFNIWSPCFQDQKKVKGVRIRGGLMLSINVPSILLPIVLAFVNVQAFDGITGVCHTGLLSTGKLSSFFLVPIFALYVVIGSLCFAFASVRDDNILEDIIKETRERYAKIEDYYRLRAYRYLWWVDDAKAYGIDDLKNVNFKDVAVAEKDETLGPTDYPEDLNLNLKEIDDRDRKPGSIYARKLKEFEMKSYVDLKSTIAPEGEAQDILAEQFAFLYTRNMTSYRERHRNGIYPRWSFAILISVILTIGLSWLTHASFIAVDPDQEVDRVKQHIKCKVTAIMQNGTSDWFQVEDSDYVSSHCVLENVYMPYRADAVVAVFLIFPAIPFFILSIAFIAGWFSTGGVPRARVLRENGSACWATSRGNDIELELLNKNDGDNQSFPAGDCQRFSSLEKIPADAHSPDLSVAISEPMDHKELESRGFSGRTLESIGKGRRKNSVCSDVQPLKLDSKTEADITNLIRLIRSSAARDGVWSERQRSLLDMMNNISLHLSYTKRMVNNDSVAWNMALDILKRIERLLQVAVRPDASPEVLLDFQGLLSELLIMIPSLNDHTSHLNSWCSAVQEAIATLRCATTGLSGNLPTSSSITGEGPSKVDNDNARSANMAQNALALIAENAIRMELNPSYRGRDGENNMQVVNAPTGLFNANGPAVSAQPAQSGSRVVDGGEMRRQVTDQIARGGQASLNNGNQNRNSNPNQAQPRNMPQNAPVAVAIAPAVPVSAANRNAASTSRNAAPRQNAPNQAVDTMPARVGPTNVISAYTESYSAVPRGFLTTLTDDELRLRVSRLREICHERLYHQEIIYMLILSGDIRPAVPNTKTGERVVKVAAYRGLFGDSPCINVSISPQTFLRYMRRRAITVVGAIGFHYSRSDRPFREYHPPVLPPIGLAELENELTLGRILGVESLLPIREFLRMFNNGEAMVIHNPELAILRSFTNYLDAFAEARGFPAQREEYVPDPQPNVHLEVPMADESAERAVNGGKN